LSLHNRARRDRPRFVRAPHERSIVIARAFSARPDARERVARVERRESFAP